MKYVILTNFDDYDYSLSCDKYGIFTFILKPKFRNEILLKDDLFHKKGATYFQEKYCTIYKKNNNELLFKFTNHKHSNSYDKQKIDLLSFNIPTKDHRIYKSKVKEIKENYYYYRINKLNKKCFDLKNKLYS